MSSHANTFENFLTELKVDQDVFNYFDVASISEEKYGKSTAFKINKIYCMVSFSNF